MRGKSKRTAQSHRALTTCTAPRQYLLPRADIRRVLREPPRAMAQYDIAALERALENAECADAEAHKLYNNLGLAHAAAGRYRAALRCHREEKRACKRLAAQNPGSAVLIDLSIAYRRCGDAMLRVDRLVDVRGAVIDARVEVVRVAHTQHLKALEVAYGATCDASMQRVEVQSACGAMAQSALALALETRSPTDFRRVCAFCARAARLADELSAKDGVSAKAKNTMMLSAAVNMAVAVSGLGDKARARKLFEAAAVRARESGDNLNLIRAIANLGEEAGEEQDWELCRAYIEEWVALAKGCNDEADEADALRKLAGVLYEQHQLPPARDALQRAVLIAGSDVARAEAQNHLQIVEQEIEDSVLIERRLEKLTEQIFEVRNTSNFMEEARLRIEAGSCAFKLRRSPDVVLHLTRYFELVDDFGCDPSLTSTTEFAHRSAVANMGEALWRLKRFDEAVQWATRELTVYGDDLAGQAQAWCNIGVYLDDDGKHEQAIEALERSSELAIQAGDDEIGRKARQNLEVVRACLSDKLASPNDWQRNLFHAEARDSDLIRRAEPHPAPPSFCMDVDESPTRGALENREDSVVIVSSEEQADDSAVFAQSAETRNPQYSTSAGSLRRPSTSFIGVSQPSLKNAVHGTTQPQFSRPPYSRDATTADRSSAGSGKYIDLASTFKSFCTVQRQTQAPLQPRESILEALRGASASLLASSTVYQNGQKPVLIDLSARFLSDAELMVLLDTISRLGDGTSVSLDISRNPILSRAGYRHLNPQSFSAAAALPAIRHLNLSCAGMDSRSLRIIADALRSDGMLSRVTHLCTSKNQLGRWPIETADALAILLLHSCSVEVVDFSLNLLPSSFLPYLVQALDRVLADGPSQSSITFLDLHLNNRREKTALLEFMDMEPAIDAVRRLFQIVPNLRKLDIRACGASDALRRSLYQLSFDELDRSGKTLVVVSQAIYDAQRDLEATSIRPCSL